MNYRFPCCRIIQLKCFVNEFYAKLNSEDGAKFWNTCKFEMTV